MPARVPVAPWRLVFLSCIRAEDAAVKGAVRAHRLKSACACGDAAPRARPCSHRGRGAVVKELLGIAVLLAIELAKTLAAARKLSSYVHKLHKITSVTKVPMHAGMCEQAGCRRGTGTGD